MTTPDGRTITIKQVAHISCAASYNDSGELVQGPWSTDSADWSEYVPESIPGYTPTVSDVPAVVVVNGQGDVVIHITYVKNGSPVVPDNPSHGNNGGNGGGSGSNGSGGVPTGPGSVINPGTNTTGSGSLIHEQIHSSGVPISNHKLPQTGNGDGRSVTALGFVGLIGALLALKRKRSDDKD